MSDWSDEETDDPINADRRNFYKVEKWSREGQQVAELLFAGITVADLLSLTPAEHSA
jgi:hypothetical protein